jgi:hypothetical protein
MNRILDLIKKIWQVFVDFFIELTTDLRDQENTAVRIGFFLFMYLGFSMIAWYNVAHLFAFVYIIWLLEKTFNKK